MLVDVQQFQTYNILHQQINIIFRGEEEKNLIISKPCLQISYQATICQIYSHKVYLLRAPGTYN